MSHTTDRRRARSAAYVAVLCARGMATTGEAARWADYVAGLLRRHAALDARDAVEPVRVTPLRPDEAEGTSAFARAFARAERSAGLHTVPPIR